MPIVAPNTPDLIKPRDNLIAALGFLIQDAANSPDDVSPWDLAAQILDEVEAQVVAVENDGTVIYRD